MNFMLNQLLNFIYSDELLYACYEFYDRFKQKPKTWLELFEFARFIKVKNVYRELAANIAKARQEQHG